MSKIDKHGNILIFSYKGYKIWQIKNGFKVTQPAKYQRLPRYYDNLDKAKNYIKENTMKNPNT